MSVILGYPSKNQLSIVELFERLNRLNTARKCMEEMQMAGRSDSFRGTRLHFMAQPLSKKRLPRS